MSVLKGLGIGVRGLVVSESFRTGSESQLAADGFLEDLGLEREVRLEPVKAVIDAAMSRHPFSPDKSDAWLAPRLHATLRLTRREAGDKRIWNYLAIVAFPDYVRWRFRDDDDLDKPVPVDRFMGEDSKNAIARLWWLAELTRDGTDYGPTTRALKTTRFSVSWQHLDAMHHRPAALAVVQFLEEFGGKGATDAQGEAIAKAFNLALGTLSLDSICENPPVDAEAVREWCSEPVDETKMIEEMPVGPDEARVPGETILRVKEVLRRLADEIDLANVKGRRRRKKPGETATPQEQTEVIVDSVESPSAL
jgi:hypothetical protein